LNPWLAGTTGGLLLAAALIAVRRHRQATLVVSLSLLAQAVVLPLFLTPDVMRFGWEGMERAQALFLLMCILLVLAALVGVRPPPIQKAPQLEANRLLGASIVASATGLITVLVLAMIQGSLAERWSRSASPETPFAGLLSAAVAGLMLFPATVLYLKQSGERVRTAIGVLASINVLAGLVFFAVSGVSTVPLALLVPLGVLVIVKDGELLRGRLLPVIAIALAALTLFRFARFYGASAYAELAGGPATVGVVDLFDDYRDTPLVLWRSFGEIHAFSAIVDWVDDGGERLSGESYLLIPASLVPGKIWSGKAAFIERARVDLFTRDAIVRRTPALITSGFYGEAYLNFGLIGLLGIAIAVGAAIRAIDDRARVSIFGLPGGLATALACGSLLVTCRTTVSQGVLMLMAQVLFLRLLPVLIPVSVQPGERGRRHAAAQDSGGGPSVTAWNRGTPGRK